MTYLLERNSRVEEDLVDHLFNSSEKRLARVLLPLANFGKEHEPEPILPKVTQEMLAEMVGTTRARVSYFMNKFRKLGFIDYNGTLEVHNSLLNVILRLATPGFSLQATSSVVFLSSPFREATRSGHHIAVVSSDCRYGNDESPSRAAAWVSATREATL